VVDLEHQLDLRVATKAPMSGLAIQLAINASFFAGAATAEATHPDRFARNHPFADRAPL
jgi:hypothetical protein